MSIQINPDKIVDYFPVQSCLWTVDQRGTVNILVQCCLNNPGQHCTRKTMCNVALEDRDTISQKNPGQCCPNTLGTTLHR